MLERSLHVFCHELVTHFCLVQFRQSIMISVGQDGALWQVCDKEFCDFCWTRHSFLKGIQQDRALWDLSNWKRTLISVEREKTFIPVTGGQESFCNIIIQDFFSYHRSLTYPLWALPDSNHKVPGAYFYHSLYLDNQSSALLPLNSDQIWMEFY